MNKEPLKLELESIVKTIIQAQEALLIVKYLSVEEDDPDKQYEKSENSFFFYSRIMFWRLSVIELSKLFLERDTEKYNFNKFLNKLSRSGIYANHGISQEKIFDWKNRVVSQKEDIENLKLQRDQVYVHIDSTADTANNTISFFQAQKLLLLAQEIIKDVYKTCYQTDYKFELLNSPSKNLESCIERLAKARSIELVELHQLKKAHGLNDEH